MLRSEAYPQLPALPKLPAKEMAGPTPWSNWVIPGRVIAGAYPASLDDAETEKILSTLLELGINTFVCLQAEVNINTPEHAWRSGHGLRPYIKDAQKILSRAHETQNPKITQQKIDFLHLPIIDGNVTTDSALNRLAEDCMERVLRGERLYVHCWGGHGRTGTLIAVMLGRLWGIPYTNALRYTQAFHDSRVYPQGVRSPQTPVQRAQVRRLLASQSATTASTPTAISTAVPARPGIAPISRSSLSTPVTASSLLSKPASSSMLSGGTPTRASVPAVSTDGARSGLTPPSPLRARPGAVAGAASSAAGGRYPGKVGESPMRGLAADVRGSQDVSSKGAAAASGAMADKLASDFNRLHGPSAGVANGGGLARPAGNPLPYVLANGRVKLR